MEPAPKTAGFAVNNSENSIQLKRVISDDREALFHWRNHPSVRQHSIHTDEISWDAHCQWFEQTLQNPQRVLLLGQNENGPVGVLRYDLHEDHSALISVYLVPERMGQGWGALLLKAGNQWLKGEYPAVSPVLAEIFPDNPASIRAFEKAGYQKALLQPQSGILTYEYIL
ncbi:GNAT family N-acetyltransferase [Vampirovibrio sp.]|uniref:GNAT family N-acetyltransferase n=1 Tax=Vampirovibrio sp. TaxID=2717857 RepID=UPI003593CAFF